ncbi:hypothetical protein DOY81_011333, partial [Sarcophaga bullata]
MQLKRPIDLGQPLNSVDGLKYLWMNWTIIGLNPPTNANVSKYNAWRILYYIYAAVINFVAAFLFPASLLAYLWFITSWQEIVQNLSLSVTIAMATFKQVAVVMHRQGLLNSNEFVKPLDERSNVYTEDRLKILKAIQKCHFFSALYISIYMFCAIGFAYIGWANHKLPYSAWFPTSAVIFTVFQNGNNDLYPLCYLTLTIAHFETLAERIKRIGYVSGPNTIEENVEELKRCIMDHKYLLCYFDYIRSAISATLFLQFFITGFVLCLTAINMIAFNRDLTEQFFAMLYLLIILFQVFPCCWYVNSLMETSSKLTTAMYSCNWMDQNQKFRKILIIFMQRSQKTNTILAGNLAPVSLQTFLA